MPFHIFFCHINQTRGRIGQFAVVMQRMISTNALWFAQLFLFLFLELFKATRQIIEIDVIIFVVIVSAWHIW